MSKKHIVVIGLDVAAVNTGVCVTKTTLDTKKGLQFEVLFELGLVTDPLRDHTKRARAADLIKGLCVQYKVDIAAIEDYIMRGGTNNTSSFQAGESSGMVKKALLELSMPLVIIPPTSMRSFLSVPSRLPDKGKQYIIDVCKEEFGFESEQTSQNRRSNVTDAFVHSVIASMIYFHLSGDDVGELNKAKSDVLFGDGKKMVGVAKAIDMFYGDWPGLEIPQE